MRLSGGKLLGIDNIGIRELCGSAHGVSDALVCQRPFRRMSIDRRPLLEDDGHMDLQQDFGGNEECLIGLCVLDVAFDHSRATVRKPSMPWKAGSRCLVEWRPRLPPRLRMAFAIAVENSSYVDLELA